MYSVPTNEDTKICPNDSEQVANMVVMATVLKRPLPTLIGSLSGKKSENSDYKSIKGNNSKKN